MKVIIQVNDLSKKFKHIATSTNLISKIGHFFKPISLEHKAVDNVSFDIHKGERIALIGLNGAGKSTLIKMLTGILKPSNGKIEVLGLNPSKKRHILNHQIGTIFGQRSQLWNNLPVKDSFILISKIYELDYKIFRKRYEELVSLFNLEPLLNKSVKQLSLGQRMQCEIVASILHKPKILFLDEPTIGLDINAKLLIRNLLHRFSEQDGITLFLTSHDLTDIEHLCNRLILLHQGRILLDSTIADLQKIYLNRKRFTLKSEYKNLILNIPGIKLIKESDTFSSFELDISIFPIEELVKKFAFCFQSITIENQTLEEMIRDIYEIKNSK